MAFWCFEDMVGQAHRENGRSDMGVGGICIMCCMLVCTWVREGGGER